MKTTPMTEPLYQYVIDKCPDPSPVLNELRSVTQELEGAGMQIPRDQGSLLFFLAKLINAKKIIEVGCYTGYSAICMASALPKDGKLITLDINEKTASIAQEFFKKAGLQDKIDLRLGSAIESLQHIEQEWGKESTDVVFIDADKVNMTHYYEYALKLLRPGGIVICDNVIWGGRVADGNQADESTTAIRALNDKIRDDDRVEKVFLHISDGLYLARKK